MSDFEDLTATTQGHLAWLFGVSLQTIENWRKEGMPGSPKRYSLREILAWQRARNSTPADRKERLQKIEEEAAEVKLELARLKLRREAGKLVELDAVERMLADRLLELRQNLQAMSHNVGPRLAPAMEVPDVQSILDDRIQYLLEQYSRPLPDELVSPQSDDSDDDDEPPPKRSKRKRVGKKKRSAKRSRKSGRKAT